MKPSYEPAVVLPQVEAFVQTRISKICATMTQMEAKDADAVVLTYTWHLTGKSPRVRDSRHFANMMNVSLRMQLSEKGFIVRNVIGIIDTMTFCIEWFPQR